MNKIKKKKQKKKAKKKINKKMEVNIQAWLQSYGGMCLFTDADLSVHLLDGTQSRRLAEQYFELGFWKPSCSCLFIKPT